VLVPINGHKILYFWGIHSVLKRYPFTALFTANSCIFFAIMPDFRKYFSENTAQSVEAEF